jgi:hypothetical protein
LARLLTQSGKSNRRKEWQGIGLRTELAILDGTWQLLRSSLAAKGKSKVLFSTFAAVCDAYLEKWVKIHNKDIRGKQRFLNDFKSRWGALPISALGFPMLINMQPIEMMKLSLQV